MEKRLFTSESVSEGHPDKVCDQIADAILDECLKQDEHSRVACEVFATREYILISGEITTNAKVDYESIARNVLKEIGYIKPEIGIGADTCQIDIRIKKQSNDIAIGVDHGDILSQGAGDQGIIFGYASKETSNYMPLAISIANDLMKLAAKKRKSGEFKHSRPDMKGQVTIDYTDKNPKVDTILMSCQHDPDFNEAEFKKYIHDEIMVPVVRSYSLNEDFKTLINPTGRFEMGGPDGDTGLTGRKLIVDTYGGYCRNGGGALSGKDPSKVDRSASYYARYIAKNLVAAGAADKLEVQLSYGIGIAEPLSVSIDTFGTAHVDENLILEAIREIFDARPGAISLAFGLTKPNFKYRSVSVYGSFGHDELDLPWERLDKVEALKAKFGK